MLPSKLKQTEETLTAHGGLVLLAEFNHGLGICRLTAIYQALGAIGVMPHRCLGID